MANERVDIPLIIGGEEIRTGKVKQAVMPHDYRHVLADWHCATETHVTQAIEAATEAHRDWSRWSWEDRAGVFLRAADLLASSFRDTVNAATMLGQSKTVHQAEIDAAAELIDFWRFNPFYAQELYAEQPISPFGSGAWNQLDYRPLEGFVYAVTPFNFTSIGGNLPTAPALMGNTVVWKPASTAMLSAYYLMRVLEAAGLPPGVINFVAGDAAAISSVALSHKDLAGVHFTGSTGVFNNMWQTIGASMSRYRSYPRIVGETGGKDFIVAHASADPQALAVAIVRGGFEYQGQKCSAASRVYVPASLWPEIRDRAVAMMREIGVGDVTDFRNFMGAVIDERAFTKISGYLAEAKKSATIIQGGGSRGETGYFIEPTLVQTTDPGARLMCEEIFGPIVTAYVYPDARVGGDARHRRPHVALRAHGRGLRARPERGHRGGDGAAPRGRQFLHQRQAHRRRRRPAALRWWPRLGHQRQGGLQAESHPLGQRPVGEGNVRAGARSQVPVPGRAVRRALPALTGPRP